MLVPSDVRAVDNETSSHDREVGMIIRMPVREIRSRVLQPIRDLVILLTTHASLDYYYIGLKDVLVALNNDWKLPSGNVNGTLSCLTRALTRETTGPTAILGRPELIAAPLSLLFGRGYVSRLRRYHLAAGIATVCRTIWY